MVRCTYSSYRFCRRIDVGAVIQLTTGFHAPAAGYQLNKREVRTGTYYANDNRRDIPPGSPCVFCEARAEFAVAARDQVQTGTAST